MRGAVGRPVARVARVARAAPGRLAAAAAPPSATAGDDDRSLPTPVPGHRRALTAGDGGDPGSTHRGCG